MRFCVLKIAISTVLDFKDLSSLPFEMLPQQPHLTKIFSKFTKYKSKRFKNNFKI